jgi:hypothetical protein
MRTYEIHVSLEVLYVTLSYYNVLVMLSMVLQFFSPFFVVVFFCRCCSVLWNRRTTPGRPPVDCIPT